MGNYHAEVLRGEWGGNAPDLPGNPIKINSILMFEL